MPLYDFKCLKCDLSFEKSAKIDERGDVKCPICDGETEVLITCKPPTHITWGKWKVEGGVS